MLHGFSFLSIRLSNLSHPFSFGSKNGPKSGLAGPFYWTISEQMIEPKKASFGFPAGLLKLSWNNKDSDNEPIQKNQNLELPDFT